VNQSDETVGRPFGAHAEGATKPYDYIMTTLLTTQRICDKNKNPAHEGRFLEAFPEGGAGGGVDRGS
jgi:hypothetical protein